MQRLQAGTRKGCILPQPPCVLEARREPCALGTPRAVWVGGGRGTVRWLSATSDGEVGALGWGGEVVDLTSARGECTMPVYLDLYHYPSVDG